MTQRRPRPEPVEIVALVAVVPDRPAERDTELVHRIRALVAAGDTHLRAFLDVDHDGERESGAAVRPGRGHGGSSHKPRRSAAAVPPLRRAAIRRDTDRRRATLTRRPRRTTGREPGSEPCHATARPAEGRPPPCICTTSTSSRATSRRPSRWWREEARRRSRVRRRLSAGPATCSCRSAPAGSTSTTSRPAGRPAAPGTTWASRPTTSLPCTGVSWPTGCRSAPTSASSARGATSCARARTRRLCSLELFQNRCGEDAPAPRPVLRLQGPVVSEGRALRAAPPPPDPRRDPRARAPAVARGRPPPRPALPRSAPRRGMPRSDPPQGRAAPVQPAAPSRRKGEWDATTSIDSATRWRSRTRYRATASRRPSCAIQCALWVRRGR